MSAVFVTVMLVSAGWAESSPIYDLRVEGSSVVINGAIFRTDVTQPLGTGHDQFLGVQGPTSQPRTEGYNTDPNKNMEFDTQPGTNSDPLAVATLDVLAGGYYGFLLDIDQTGVNSFLAMDRLEIYLGNAPDLTDFISGGAATNPALYGSNTTGFGVNSRLIYNMDAAPDGPTVVLLDYDNGIKNGPGGSGIGDMLLLVPSSLFTPYQRDFPWVYLYSRFGDTGNCLPGVSDGTCVNNGGPERWHTVSGPAGPPPSVPEPASLLLFGPALGWAAMRRRRGPATAR